MDQFIKLLNEATLAFHQIPSGFWQALLASGVLSPLIKTWKHLRFTKKEREIAEWAMFLVTVGVAFAASALQYLLTTHPDSPKVIALHTAVLGFTLQPVYFLAVKPIWKFFSQKFGEAAQLEAQLKSAAIPAEGLPLAGTSVSAVSAQEALHASLSTDDFNQ